MEKKPQEFAAMKDALKEKSLNLVTANDVCKQSQNLICMAERILPEPKVPLIENGNSYAAKICSFRDGLMDKRSRAV